jgi:hypothetical protein
MIIIWLARTSPIFQGASADYGGKSSGHILWEVGLHGRKTILSKTFQKKSSLLWSISCQSVVALPAYFLDNQGVTDAMFLPVIEFSKSTCLIHDFNPKSMKTKKGVRILYNSKNGHSLMKS